MMGGLTAYVKNLEFARSAGILIENPGKMLLIASLDALFFFTAMIMRRFAESLDTAAIAENPALIAGMLALSILYYAALLLIYSFFKLCVLGLVKSAVEKAEFSFKRLWKFCLLNLLIFSALLGASIMAGMILDSAKENFRLWAWGLIGLPFIIAAYSFMNLAHSAFAQGDSIKESIKRGLKGIKNQGIYTRIIIPSIIIAAVLSLPYSYLYLRANPAMSAVLQAVFEGLAYAILFVNRISFYIASQSIK